MDDDMELNDDVDMASIDGMENMSELDEELELIEDVPVNKKKKPKAPADNDVAETKEDYIPDLEREGDEWTEGDWEDDDNWEGETW